MNKTVISLDIDLLFECQTYAKYTQHDLPADLAWDIIELIQQKHDKKINTKVNERLLSKVSDILMDKVTKDTEILIIDEHDEIIEVLEDLGASNVYNFDFHCDITYGEDDTELNIENWVRHGKNMELIDNYYWIHRTMSEMNLTSPFTHYKDNIDQIDHTLIPKADAIVICISKHFTPRKYWGNIPLLLEEELKKIKERDYHRLGQKNS